MIAGNGAAFSWAELQWPAGFSDRLLSGGGEGMPAVGDISELFEQKM